MAEIADISLDKFCETQRISEEVWKSADIEWDVIRDIIEDHSSRVHSLTASAAMYSGLIQNMQGVHSVRWRVKNPLHLAQKIVRKRADGKDAYKHISSENYFEIVTDLIGIRALHIFKDEFEEIHKAIQPLMQQKEAPVVNIREGDHGEFLDLCKALGLEVKTHAAGYRSIHYVKTVRPLDRVLHIEIQVRTVFEEGWSEVDHTVRYPNFSEHPLVEYASLILNRLSGMADEMSTYTRKLIVELNANDAIIGRHQMERDDAVARMEDLFERFEHAKQDTAAKDDMIKGLKNELMKLRAAEAPRAAGASINALAAISHLSSLGAIRDAETHVRDISNLSRARLMDRGVERIVQASRKAVVKNTDPGSGES